MLKTSASPETDKLLGLEGLRFLATFSILIWHYQHFAYFGDKPVDLVKSELPYYGWLSPFYQAGEHSVWIFWCISGFIFFWKYRDAISGGAVSARRFFVLRLSRLYPLHFMTLIAVALLQSVYFAHSGAFFVYQHNDVPHFVAQLFMASDWLPGRSDSFNGPIWSVSVEVLVYAAFFLTLRYATRSPLFNVLVILACVNVRLQVCACLAFFYAGGLAAIARQTIAASRWRGPLALAAWCLAGIIPVAILSLGLPIVPWIGLLAYTPILLVCFSGRMRIPSSLQRLLEGAGNMTYSCYLLHFPIQLAIVVAFSIARLPIPLYDQRFWAAFVIATLLASRLVYRHFEAPAQRLIRSTLLIAETRRPAPVSPWPEAEALISRAQLRSRD